MNGLERPKTRYAKAGDVHIAYQFFGDEDRDLIFIPNWFSNIEMFWEHPRFEQWFRRLGSFARVIVLDQRGSGLSDSVAIEEMILLEERARDILAVMDAARSERAALFACAYTAPLACYFAATYVDRASELILLDPMARPDGSDEEVRLTEEDLARVLDHWGDPSFADGEERFGSATAEFLAKYRRMSMGPGTAHAVFRAARSADVRHVLGAIQAPTLVLRHEPNRLTLPVEHSEILANAISGAHLVRLGEGSSWGGDDQPEILGHVEEFLTGVRRTETTRRALATVLFTDVVGSTDRVAAIGDRAWTEILQQHGSVVAGSVKRFDGQLIQVKGEESFSRFDGPGRAIRCAKAIHDSLSRLDIKVRAGVHTGEVEFLPNGDLAGIAVHIGARIASLAGPGDIFVSRTVADLVAGSDIAFEARGEHELKGVPGRWSVYVVAERFPAL